MTVVGANAIGAIVVVAAVIGAIVVDAAVVGANWWSEPLSLLGCCCRWCDCC